MSISQGSWTTTTTLALIMMTLLSVSVRRTGAFGSRSLQVHRQQSFNRQWYASSTALRDTSLDDQGRRVRNRPTDDNDNGGGWEDFDPVGQPARPERSYSQDSSRSSGGGGGGGRDSNYGWDDVGPPPARSDRSSSAGGRQSNRNDYGDSSSSAGRRNSYDSSSSKQPFRKQGGGGDRRKNNNSSSSNSYGNNNNNRQMDKEEDARKINMKALEGAGFCHLYGLSSVLNALAANRRDLRRPEDVIDMTVLEGEDYQHELKQRERKPEAQYTPWLFVQEQRGPQRGRSTDKAAQAEKLLELAKERNIPVATVDKGVLNTLSGNRPHQGYVLRCGAHLDFESIIQLPHPDQDPAAPTFWLALDEVVDPQNLGALLRSAYFLGDKHKMGVLVCAKNSAPPSPVVSAASAGALELVTVHSTSNLPRTLATAESDGFRIVGASAYVPRDLETALYDLQELPPSDKPTIVVLGSEGHGLRTLVAKSCTEFVKIPGAGDADGVDSLNVSVTGGILLWHFLNGSNKK